MSTRKLNVVQFLRFCTVGAGNTAVDFGSFYLLSYFGISYMPAQYLSFSAGVINSFIFNRKWTFQVTRKVIGWEMVKFVIVNGLALLISSGLLFELHNKLLWNLWLSKFTATAVTTVMTYMGSKLWVFSARYYLGHD